MQQISGIGLQLRDTAQQNARSSDSRRDFLSVADAKLG